MRSLMTSVRVEPAALPRANVLGIGVHAVNMDTAVRAIEAAVAEHERGYVCVTGVHGVMEAQGDPEFARILAKALLVVPDGVPTVWMGHLQGFTQMDRVFGPDLMLAVAHRSEQTGWSHLLYGGSEGVVQRLSSVLLHRFPRMRITGAYTPPFRPLTSAEESDFLHLVDQLHPDIIWVGLGTPKQERFMAEYLPHLNTTLMIGVGAAFDFHTGRIRDSPPWIKRSGLQWFHRLLQEPSRLWKRYLFNNPRFVFRAAQQLAGLRHYSLTRDNPD